MTRRVLLALVLAFALGLLAGRAFAAVRPPAPAMVAVSPTAEPPHRVRWQEPPERAGAPPTPAPAVKKRGAVPAALRVTGLATWYCSATSPCTRGYPSGMYAAAGSELRIGAWRGRSVKVCAVSSCVVVRLIDSCACAGSRVIDLYSEAFAQLAPLSRGVVEVTVKW